MKFILATRNHEARFREIVRTEAMPGHIQIAYEREPDFFHGLETLGTFNQVIAATEAEAIVGFGCRSIRPLFINGNETDIGYLSGLRSSAIAKSKLGLARGYKMLKELHTDQRCPGYITTIIEGNLEASATIASGRAGLPAYKDLGECLTFAIPLKRRRKTKPHPALTIRFARNGEEALVANTLRQLGNRYQFFPALQAADFNTPLLRNLSITNFLIIESREEPHGIAAIWDQSAFKQHRIRAYSRAMRRAKPLINWTLKSAGYAPLPAKGEPLNHAYCCFAAVRNNDPNLMRVLVDHAYRHLAESGYAHMIIGFHAGNPARSALSGLPKTVYRSRLFFVGWEAEKAAFDALDERIIHFDPAIL